MTWNGGTAYGKSTYSINMTGKIQFVYKWYYFDAGASIRHFRVGK